jgi:hypothetical protein
VTVIDSMPLTVSSVMVQNQMPGPTVIAADVKRSYEMIFAGKGDPQGEDVQEVPEELLRTKQFRDALRKGVLAVIEGEDHPVVVAAMARQSTAFQDRIRAEQTASREVLDSVADNDIVVVTCIGPGPRTGAVCGDQVPIKDKDQASLPPLCDRHRHLADSCVKRGGQPWVLEDQGGQY